MKRLVTFFSRKIDNWFEKREKILDETDPNHITVTEISEFFSIPKWYAKLLLNMGVRDGFFEKNNDGTYKAVLDEFN